MSSGLMGTCAGCGAGIPWGWVPLLASPDERASEVPLLNAAFKTVVRRINLFCRRCPESQDVISIERHHRRRRVSVAEEQNEQQPVELTPKDIAVKLLGVLSDEPASSKKLLRRAELDEDYLDVAKLILKKLAAAGKIKKVHMDEGGIRWSSI